MLAECPNCGRTSSEKLINKRGICHPCWEILREKIYNRDNRRCGICYIRTDDLSEYFRMYTKKLEREWLQGKRTLPGANVILCCHHIDMNPINNDEINLISVCKNCHALIHAGLYRSKYCSLNERVLFRIRENEKQKVKV